MRQQLAGAALALALLACGDADNGPTGVSQPVSASAAAKSDPQVIEVKSGAPPLATNRASFWAVQGRETGVVIRYRSEEGEGEEQAGEPFLEFTVPGNARMVDPSGRRLARGDSILIEVSVVPGQLAARFSPEGLVFAGKAAARLAISYTNGDLPVEPPRRLAIWYLPCDGGAWEQQRSRIDRQSGMVVGDLYHFSNYAVAY